MKNKEKLELINTDLEVFYVPYTLTGTDIYKVHAKSIEHAIQKFNFMMTDGQFSLKPCRKVSLIEKQANTAYKNSEYLDVVKIFSRKIDFYDVWDREIIEHPNIKLANQHIKREE